MRSAVRGVDPVFYGIVPPGGAEEVLIQHDAADPLDQCLDISFYWVLMLVTRSRWVDADAICIEEMLRYSAVVFRGASVAANSPNCMPMPFEQVDDLGDCGEEGLR